MNQIAAILIREDISALRMMTTIGRIVHETGRTGIPKASNPNLTSLELGVMLDDLLARRGRDISSENSGPDPKAPLAPARDL